MMLDNFTNQIVNLFKNGVFGVSLLNISIIILSFIIALLIRGIFARFIVNKVKKIVLKTSNEFDDKLFDALISPFKLLPIVLVFLVISLYFDIETTLGLYFLKINNTLATIFVFWLIYQSLIPLSFIFQKLEYILTKALVLWISKSIKYVSIERFDQLIQEFCYSNFFC